MESALILDLLVVLEKHNVIPAYFLRNERIRLEFKMMRADGTSSKLVKDELADRYNVSVKTIEVIVYGKDAKQTRRAKGSRL